MLGLLVGAVPLGLLALGFALSGGSSPDSPSPSPTALRASDRAAAEAWEQAARGAFEPALRALPELAQLTSQGPEIADAELEERLADVVRDLEEGRRRVRRLPSSPADPLVLPLYRHSIGSYLASARALGTGVDVGDGPELREELVRLSHRLRLLGDRIFDRGLRLLERALGRPPAIADEPGVRIHAPDEVPDWEARGVAAGPPLEDEEQPEATGVPPERDPDRPQQPLDDWLEAYDTLGLPTASEVGEAVEQREEEALANMARRLVAGAERLRDEPDPRDGRELSARVRLGLLVLADAARAGQAATLVEEETAEELGGIAERLVAIGGSRALSVQSGR